MGRCMLFPEAGEFVLKGDDVVEGLIVAKRGGEENEGESNQSRSSESSSLNRKSRHQSNMKL